MTAMLNPQACRCLDVDLSRDPSAVRSPSVQFTMFGGLRVTDGDVLIESFSPKQRLVLAVLLLHAGRVVSVDRLVDLAWGEDADLGSSTLHSHVSRLRTLLEPGRPRRERSELLVTQPPGYRLDVERSQVDVFRFEDGIAEGRQRLRDDDPRSAVDILTVHSTLLRAHCCRSSPMNPS
ncbi:AfsR/SARP family transcriptional regulator [Ilumatobacter nonamiensis]|uniref:AfsR/SARP family transcriptional regulator n=1 Tax=Ilumatobacter nonamiensis TaxID=467093 RepID=UPI0011D1C83C